MRNKSLITWLKERNVPFCLTHQFIMCLKPKETSSDRKCVLDIFSKWIRATVCHPETWNSMCCGL